MKTDKKKTKLTQKEIKDVRELENPSFKIKISILTYSDLKKWHIINPKVFNDYIKKKIKRDYDGSDCDE